MATSMNENSRNNLDKYLHDLYEKEIQLRVSDEELSDIQTGVETVVFRILAQIAEREPKLAVDASDVLKVGSFYEGTKICYPDEFDFLVRFDCRNDDEEDVEGVKDLLKLYPWYLKRAVDEMESSSNSSPHGVSHGINTQVSSLKVMMPCGQLVLDGEPEEHGPAIKLRLLYKTDKAGHDEKKEIYVDITAAIKVQGIPDYILEEDDEANGHFKEMALQHQHHLIVFNENQDIPSIETFTEVEMHFIKEVLSEQHRQVFKLLKYLVNGKHTIEPGKGHVFSSYAMKTMMFNHHFECPGHCELSTCTLMVLKAINELLKDAVSNVSVSAMKQPITIWQNVFTGRSFSKKVGKEVKKCMRHLKQLINNLEMKIGNMSTYSYDECAVHVKSLIDY